jgi:hypothetical protein
MSHLLHGLTALVLIVVGYRSFGLESRVSALSSRAAAAEDAEPAPAQAPPVASVVADSDDPRLTAAAGNLARLREEVANLKRRLARAAHPEDLDSAANAERILQMVHGARVREQEKAISYYRDRWIAHRTQAVGAFGQRYQLSPEQREGLAGLLETETDAVVGLLQDPSALEDPDAATRRWRDIMNETDRGARRVLDSDQLEAFLELREAERERLGAWIDLEGDSP